MVIPVEDVLVFKPCRAVEGSEGSSSVGLNCVCVCVWLQGNSSMCVCVCVGRSCSYHMSGLQSVSVEAHQTGAVLREAITVLQLLGVTRGLVLVWVCVLEEEEGTERECGGSVQKKKGSKAQEENN